MSQRIIVCQGIPASGKSTWAKEYVKELPLERVRINRDDIRNMLGSYWVPQREKLVTMIEINSITSALDLGYTTILDSTNLNPKTTSIWIDMANKYSIPIEYKPFYISLEEALKRDRLREFPVTDQIITSFYNKYNNTF